jgi:hypothetical protein
MGQIMQNTYFGIVNISIQKKPSPEFHQTITPDGSVANKFSSLPTGTEYTLPVGY